MPHLFPYVTHDPIEEAIDKQLANPYFNPEHPSTATIILQAVEECQRINRNREAYLVRLRIAGYTNREIAENMGMSLKKVKKIFQKMRKGGPVL